MLAGRRPRPAHGAKWAVIGIAGWQGDPALMPALQKKPTKKQPSAPAIRKPTKKPTPATPKASVPSPTNARVAKSGNKPRPSRTGPLARSVEVSLEVDKDLKRRWERAIDAVRDAKREGAGAFDVLWETVAEIVEHEPPLYLAGGIATTKQFLSAHLGETERSARRWMRVAKFASPAEEARYGVSKIDAVIGYLEAKGGAAVKGRLPVKLDELKIPIERDGGTTRLSIEEATVEAIETAARKLKRAAQKTPKAVSPALAAITRELSKGKLRGVSAKLAGGKLLLGAIPLDGLVELADALRRVKLPTSTG